MDFSRESGGAARVGEGEDWIEGLRDLVQAWQFGLDGQGVFSDGMGRREGLCEMGRGCLIVVGLHAGKVGILAGLRVFPLAISFLRGMAGGEKEIFF